MKTFKQSAKSGAALALMMAGLSGCGSLEKGAVSAQSSGSVDLVHCYGVNVCKGHNACSSANNACHGQGSCKGTGFVNMPKQSCLDVGGHLQDNWVGEVSKVDLVHCYGVNVCKGHNACNSPNNACGGLGSCKGTGFVKSPAEACNDIGGEGQL